MQLSTRVGSGVRTRGGARIAPGSVAGSALAAFVVATAAPPLGPAPAASTPPAQSTSGASPAGSARRAQFSVVATVPGRYGSYSPWSPTTPLFAYCDDKGVIVLDVTKTPLKPLRVASGVDSDCTWSPDGTWLLARTPTHKADAQGASLVVVP